MGKSTHKFNQGRRKPRSQINKAKALKKRRKRKNKAFKMSIDSGNAKPISGNAKPTRKSRRLKPAHARSKKMIKKLKHRTKIINRGSSGLIVEQRKLAKEIYRISRVMNKSKKKITELQASKEAQKFVKNLKGKYSGDFALQAVKCKEKRLELMVKRKKMKKEKKTFLQQADKIAMELSQAIKTSVKL